MLKRTVGQVHAVDGVDLEVKAGETLGSSASRAAASRRSARTIIKLDRADRREDHRSNGDDITQLQAPSGCAECGASMQIVFQDPYASLNPRMTVRDIVAEPLRIHGVSTRAEGGQRASTSSCGPSA